ncbi:extracellular serine-rich protein [Seiridium cupressi]
MQFTTLALAALLGLASAQTVHVVSVATTNNSLIFTPDNIQVPAGDMVQFQFRAGNHSVVQSTFDAPCSPISEHTNQTGAFSGFQPVAASSSTGMVPTWTVMVANTNPLWFYCATGKHCQAGMVMVINENTAANATRSLAEFKKLAAAATANVAPGSGTSTNGGSSSGSGSGSAANTGSGTGAATTGSTTNSGAAASSSVSTAGVASVAVSTTLSLLLGAAAALFVL